MLATRDRARHHRFTAVRVPAALLGDHDRLPDARVRFDVRQRSFLHRLVRQLHRVGGSVRGLRGAVGVHRERDLDANVSVKHRIFVRPELDPTVAFFVAFEILLERVE